MGGGGHQPKQVDMLFSEDEMRVCMALKTMIICSKYHESPQHCMLWGVHTPPQNPTRLLAIVRLAPSHLSLYPRWSTFLLE